MEKTRREVILATGGLVLVAGCSGNGSDSADPETDTRDDSGTDDSDGPITDGDGTDSDDPEIDEIELYQEPYTEFPSQPVHYQSVVELTEQEVGEDPVTKVREHEFITDGAEVIERRDNTTTSTYTYGEAEYDDHTITRLESGKPVVYRRVRREMDDRRLMLLDYPEEGDDAAALTTWADRYYELFLEDTTEGTEVVEETAATVDFDTGSFEEIGETNLQLVLGIPSIRFLVTPVDNDGDNGEGQVFEVVRAETRALDIPMDGEIVVTDDGHVDSLAVTGYAEDDEDGLGMTIDWELQSTWGDDAVTELSEFPDWAGELSPGAEVEFTVSENFLAIENVGSETVRGPFEIDVMADEDSFTDSPHPAMRTYTPAVDHPDVGTGSDEIAVPPIELEPGDTLYLYREDSTAFTWDAHSVNDPGEARDTALDSPFSEESSDTLPTFDDAGTGVALQQLSAVDFFWDLYRADYHDELVPYYEQHGDAWDGRSDALTTELTVESDPEVISGWDP